MAYSYMKTIDFLREVDEDLVQYESILNDMGFTSTRSLKFLLSSDIPSIPKAHSRLLISEINKLSTPSISTNNNIKTSSVLKPKELFHYTENTTTETEEDDPEPFDAFTFYKYESPIEKEIGEQELKLESKSSEIQTIQTQIKALENMYTSASADDLSVGVICSHCHVRGSHKSTNCVSEKCVTR
jgi:hypothetical protein